MSYDEIISRIKEKTSLADAEIKSRVEAKLKQLSGLISKEGAAHIVANECGVRLFEQVSGRLQIKNILVGMRDVETVGKIVGVYPSREFQTTDRTGRVGSFILGDETGNIRIVLWNEMADKTSELAEGMVVRVMGGYVRERNKFKEVHLNNRGKLILNPEGETVGELKQLAVRKKIAELNEQDGEVDLLATIVQVFDLRFFEICPECGRRSRWQDNGFACDTHGIVNPDYSYVLNLFVDDSDNIRMVCFRNQVQELVGKTNDVILRFKENPELFEEVKNELLGTLLKIRGRVVKNEMFDRLEIIANHIDKNIDAQQEIDKLSKEIEELKDSEEPEIADFDETKETEEIVDDVEATDE